MRHVEAEIKTQYENYPYPMRDPAEEKRRLIITPAALLDRINFYCFSGRRKFYSGFRALIAGGGTGDAVIMLAEQLRGTPAEITYLDLSTASMEIAKRRAAVRKLDNIKWVRGSLLDLPQMDIEKYDFINCSGVLHHLEYPEKGLAALNNVLKDNGAMSVMVYAPYGRSGVYLIQDLMRHINQYVSDARTKIENTRHVLHSLPRTNIAAFVARDRFSVDIETFGDIGIYDLFLHSQDRAYSIPQLYELVDSEGLEIIQLFGDFHRDQRGKNLGNRAYEPHAHVSDTQLLEQLRTLQPRAQQAISELLHGGFHMHAFYLARYMPSRPNLADLDYVPSFCIQWPESIISHCRKISCEARDEIVIQERDAKGSSSCEIRFRKTPHTDMFMNLIDGYRTLGEIYDSVSEYSQTNRQSIEHLSKEFETIFGAFNIQNRMFLRHKSVSKYPTVEEMQSRVGN